MLPLAVVIITIYNACTHKSLPSNLQGATRTKTTFLHYNTCHSTHPLIFLGTVLSNSINRLSVLNILFEVYSQISGFSSIEDYFQASGRGGRSRYSAYSIVYWTPKDCQTCDWMVKSPSFMIRNILSCSTFNIHSTQFISY